MSTVAKKTFIENVTLEDVRIAFRNFEGKEDQYNRAGDRNFLAILPDDIAQIMEEKGWNIKYLRSRNPEEDPPKPYLKVAVSYKNKPPRATLVTSRGRNALDENLVMILDSVDIAKVDLIVTPYNWSVNGKTGVKAYLKSIFVTVAEDELELKYAHIPDAVAPGQERLAIEAAPLEDLGELRTVGSTDSEDDESNEIIYDAEEV